jgi:hypothetical protein
MSMPVSFANNIQPLLNERCTGCHNAGQLDFDFTPGTSYAKLVNAKSKSCPGRTFVIPGDVKNSYLIDKMTPILGLCAGSSMRYETTDAEIEMLTNWILQGAPNN